MRLSPPKGGGRGRRRPGCTSPRGRTVRGHDQQVGQASDQASDVVGQAGAGSVRALRSQGTSWDGQLQLRATRAAGVSLPRRDSTRPSISLSRTASYDPSHSPHQHQPDRHPKRVTAGSITFTNHISASELQPTLDARSRADGGRSGKPCLPSRRWVPGPSWGRDTTVNNGQSRCPMDNQTRSSSAVTGRDRL